jgi:hypothetical protein
MERMQLIENRNGLLVDLKISQATGTAEREPAEEMIKRHITRRSNKHTHDISLNESFTSYNGAVEAA